MHSYVTAIIIIFIFAIRRTSKLIPYVCSIGTKLVYSVVHHILMLYMCIYRDLLLYCILTLYQATEIRVYSLLVSLL